MSAGYERGDHWANADVVEMHKTCEREAEFHIIDAKLATAWFLYDADVSDALGRAAVRLESSVLRLLGKAIKAPTVIAVCPFDDTVEVTLDRGTAWWSCPVCDADHQDEVDDE